MSNKPIDMHKLRQIIRLYCQGTGIRTISGLLGISRNTIKKYLGVWHGLNISYEVFSVKNDAELSDLFSTPASDMPANKRRDELLAMLPKFSRDLKKKGVTREMLFHTYLQDHPEGYARSQFNGMLRTHLALSRPVMHIEHKAGGTKGAFIGVCSAE